MDKLDKWFNTLYKEIDKDRYGKTLFGFNGINFDNTVNIGNVFAFLFVISLAGLIISSLSIFDNNKIFISLLASIICFSFSVIFVSGNIFIRKRLLKNLEQKVDVSLLHPDIVSHLELIREFDHFPEKINLREVKFFVQFHQENEKYKRFIDKIKFS